MYVGELSVDEMTRFQILRIEKEILKIMFYYSIFFTFFHKISQNSQRIDIYTNVSNFFFTNATAYFGLKTFFQRNEREKKEWAYNKLFFFLQLKKLEDYQ
jgi:hypothetical protein